MGDQPNSDFDKDMKLIEASMSLAAFGAQRFDARRGYEWKMSFGVWALIAAALIQGFVAFPLIALLFPLLYGRWLQNIWIRHATDGEIMWNFANEAQRLMGVHGITTIAGKPHLRIGRGKQADGWRKYAGFISDWSLGFQFFITVGLFCFIYLTSDKITFFQMILKSTRPS